MRPDNKSWISWRAKRVRKVWRYAISLVRHCSLKAHSFKTKIHTNMQIFSAFSIFHVDYDRFKVILDQSSGSEYMAFNCTDVFCEHALLTSCFSYPTVGENNQESRCKYWATHSSICSHRSLDHSSTLLTLLARSLTLLAPSLIPSLEGQ